MLYMQEATQVVKGGDGEEGEKYISINKAFVVEPKGEKGALT